METGEKAQRKMKLDPTALIPKMPPRNEIGEQIALADYWKHIYYKLGPEEFKGLLLFLRLTTNLYPQYNTNDVRGKIIRWQELLHPKYEVRI